MTKSEAPIAVAHTIDPLTERERLAIELIDRLAADPHAATDTVFEELKQAFSEEK